MKPRLLFLVTEDWYFWSHRLPIARAARNLGFDVIIATHIQDHEEVIRREGFRVIPIRLRRKGKNILQELLAILELKRIYKTERPDIVHHVAMKPVLYGSIAARLTGIPSVVNALAGLGYIFISTDKMAAILRFLIKPFFQIIFNTSRSWLILQNPDDYAMFSEKGLIKKEKVSIIRGSGVDTKQYVFEPEPIGDPVVMLVGRMLWDKGIGEFVNAARLLHERHVRARLVLIGKTDEDNPASIPVSVLVEWQKCGFVEWWGYRKDMPHVYPLAHIVSLPSYREGLPKVLLEAAACGRPIVATDVPGCREIVRDGENGFLVPVRDATALADALQRLIEDRPLRSRMGTKGREMVLRDFSDEKVVHETLAIYRRSLCCSLYPAMAKVSQ